MPSHIAPSQKIPMQNSTKKRKNFTAMLRQYTRKSSVRFPAGVMVRNLFRLQSHRQKHKDPHPSDKMRSKKIQCVLHPHSKLYIAWDILISFLVVWNIFYTPIAIAFPEDATKVFTSYKLGEHSYAVESIIEAISDVVFILDIIICCRTIIIEEIKGHTIEISDAQVIIQRYMAGFFVFDVLGVGIPFGDYWMHRLDAWVDGAWVDFTRYDRYFALLGLFKFFRIAKLNVIFNRFFKVPPNKQDYVRVFKILLYLSIVTNLGSCLFYYSACDDFSYPRKGSWVDVNGMMDANFGEKWLSGFYFTLFTMTSIGYGSPGPSIHAVEMLSTILIMVAGVLFFAVLAGNLISISHGVNANHSVLNERLLDMHVFAKSRSLPKKLHDTVNATIKCVASVNKTTCNPKVFLKDIPTALRRKMFQSTRTKQLMHARVFIPCSYAFVQAVSRQMETHVYPEGAYITRAGEINDKTDTLILIRIGFADIYGFNDKTKIGTVCEAQGIGLPNGFVRNIKRLFTTIAATTVECFSLQCRKVERVFLTHRRSLAPVLQHVIGDVTLRFQSAKSNTPMYQPKSTIERYGSDETQKERLPRQRRASMFKFKSLKRSANSVMRGHKLAVRVYEARNMDKVGGRLSMIDVDPDVQVVVRLLKSKEQTPLAHDNANPYWDQLMVIDDFAQAKMADIVYIDIIEANFFCWGNVKLAQLELSVGYDIMDGPQINGWYKVPIASNPIRNSSVMPINADNPDMPVTGLVPSTDESEPAIRLSVRVVGSSFSTKQRICEVNKCLELLEKKAKVAGRSAQIYEKWLSAQFSPIHRASPQNNRASSDQR